MTVCFIASNQCREVEILLGLRSGQHEKCSLEDCTEIMEGVREPPTFVILLANFLDSSARMFFGRGAVMAKALGTTPEEECRQGIHVLAKVTPIH